MVVLAIIERVTRRGRGRLCRGVGVQFVAIVTDADLKFDWCINWVDHRGGEEGSVKFVLVSAKEGLQKNCQS